MSGRVLLVAAAPKKPSLCSWRRLKLITTQQIICNGHIPVQEQFFAKWFELLFEKGAKCKHFEVTRMTSVDNDRTWDSYS